MGAEGTQRRVPGGFLQAGETDVGNRKFRTVTRADLLKGWGTHGREQWEHKMLGNWVEPILLSQTM